MNDRSDLSRLARCFAALEEDAVISIIEGCIACEGTGETATCIVGELTRGMEDVGRMFKNGDYALAEIIYSGELFKLAMDRVKPFMKPVATTGGGSLVMGTVQGDIHDLGKNIVTMLLECSGFDVVDLGVDVPPDAFVRAVKDSGARLVGMSLLLTTALDAMRGTISALAEAGLRDQVTIMIGGAPTSEKLRDEIGADFYGRDAIEAVAIARKVFSVHPGNRGTWS
ncbi:MAG: cobalamin-dependent protein [Desulfomonilia bacterium]|nr:cobalamin-dependent protein [Desulfomonilia bacterium]